MYCFIAQASELFLSLCWDEIIGIEQFKMLSVPKKFEISFQAILRVEVAWLKATNTAAFSITSKFSYYRSQNLFW